MTAGEQVMATARAARDRAAARSDTFLERLDALVSIDSGVDSPAGRDEVASLLCEWAARASCDCELVDHQAGRHLIARLPGRGDGRIVLLGHHDTVFPAGTAEERPLRVEDDVAYGPGVADMKGGLLVGLLAVEALADGPRRFASVELHSVPDEEIRTEPFATIDRVRGADAVLVLECGRQNGDLVYGRKTGAWVRLEVLGRAAHAGTEPERGRSAINGLCREILRCEALDGARDGLTAIAGTVRGGTIPNVVPASAEAVFDVRAPRGADFEWALAEMARADTYDGLDVRLETVGRWPGIEQDDSGRALQAACERVAATLGEPLGGQVSGGMSDGCWTAALGLPTIDGLGPVGGLDHSPREYVRLDSVPTRCGLIAGLCEAIGDGLLDGRGMLQA